MTRTYELCFIVEPRVSDDDAQKICDKYTKLIDDGGGEITYVDHWGKRKLAYPINNFNEGRYYVIYVSIDGAMSWTAIERLLMQDEAVLRHLVVRTDEDLKRAARKGKVQPPVPGAEPEQKSEKKSAESRSSQRGDHHGS